MSTVQDILLDVRDSLADLKKERWDDDSLIRTLNEAQRKINRKSKYLRCSTSLPINKGQSTYTLPSDTLAITRVLYNNRALRIIGHEQMDFKFGKSWETNFGTPAYAITNKLEKGLLKLSPIPAQGDNEIIDFTDVDLLNIYYIRNPKKLTNLTDELELDELFDTALKHYIVGTKLRADMDTQNRALGAEELQLYMVELDSVIKLIDKDFTDNINFYEVPYRSMT